MRIVPSAAPRRGLRGAAWIVVVVTLFFAAVAFVQIRAALRVAGTRPSATASTSRPTASTWRTSRCRVTWWSPAACRATGSRPWCNPPLLTPARVDSLNRAIRGKYLTPDDRVIGVVRRGRGARLSRARPGLARGRPRHPRRRARGRVLARAERRRRGPRPASAGEVLTLRRQRPALRQPPSAVRPREREPVGAVARRAPSPARRRRHPGASCRTP